MRKKILFLIGLIILFGGLDIAILLSHMNRLFGVLMIFVGIGIMAYSLIEVEVKKLVKPGKENIASAIISLFLSGKIKPLLPVFGVLIICFVFSFNLIFYKNIALGSHDLVTVLMGIVLIVYNYIPQKFEVEKNFALLFIIILFVILVVPLTIYNVLFGGGEEINSPFIFYLLVSPVSAILNIVGIQSWVEGLTKIHFILQNGEWNRISIGLSCTGLYSVSIFISAFTSFTLLEYKKLDRKVLVLLMLGVVTSWVANILRMTLIIVIGSYYGMGALTWAHHNLGEIIFMIWIGLFWYIMFKYLIEPDKKKMHPEQKKKKVKNVCNVCKGILKIDIPAMRCSCGAFYHKICIENIDRCKICGKKFQERNNDK